MSVMSELYDRLIADASVSALVGIRIYPLVLSQDTAFPALTYTRVSTERLHHLGGVSGRATMRVSFSCWAETIISAESLADAVRSSLDGFNGILSTIDAEIKIDNELELYEDELGTADEPDGLYRTIQDYRVSYKET